MSRARGFLRIFHAPRSADRLRCGINALLVLALLASFTLQVAHVHHDHSGAAEGGCSAAAHGHPHGPCGDPRDEAPPEIESDEPCGLCLVAAQPKAVASLASPAAQSLLLARSQPDRAHETPARSLRRSPAVIRGPPSCI